MMSEFKTIALYCPRCGDKLPIGIMACSRYHDMFYCECGFSNVYLSFSRTPLKELNEVERCGSPIKINIKIED